VLTNDDIIELVRELITLPRLLGLPRTRRSRTTRPKR
jgi:hypothetical protein